METLAWKNVGDKFGNVLALSDQSVSWLEFEGNDAERKASEAVTALTGGKGPELIAPKKGVVLPLASIRRVEVSHGRDAVRIFGDLIDGPVKIKFHPAKGSDAADIAWAVVGRAPISTPERSEAIGIGEALMVPAILGAVALWLWGILYYVSTTVESGDEADINRNPRRGLAKLILQLSDTIGSKGAIVLGVILLSGFLAWIVRRIVWRPRKRVWGA